MSFFGIPFFISYQFYLDSLNTYFGTYSQYSTFIASDFVIPCYILCNFIYLWFMLKIVVPFIYKVICYFLNFFD